LIIKRLLEYFLVVLLRTPGKGLIKVINLIPNSGKSDENNSQLRHLRH
jgi:hypothetical protein